MGAAVAYDHGVNLAAWASKDVTRVALLHDFARLNAVCCVQTTFARRHGGLVFQPLYKLV